MTLSIGFDYYIFNKYANTFVKLFWGVGVGVRGFDRTTVKTRIKEQVDLEHSG